RLNRINISTELIDFISFLPIYLSKYLEKVRDFSRVSLKLNKLDLGRWEWELLGDLKF
uniref:Uncharacterized protein n=1 Tax=Marmota marmota marmota TaxID=9994 RepID=A0A8C5ZBY3_MARMA